MDVTYLPGESRLFVPHLTVEGPDVALTLSGDVGWDEMEHVNVHLEAQHMSFKALIPLWPTHIASGVRAWLVGRLDGGTLDQGTLDANLTADDLAAIRNHHAAVDSPPTGDLSLSKCQLQPLRNIPFLSGLDVKGSITGRHVAMQIAHGNLDLGNNHILTLTDGTFGIADMDPVADLANLTGHVSGSVQAAADFLSRDSVKPFVNLPL